MVEVGGLASAKEEIDDRSRCEKSSASSSSTTFVPRTSACLSLIRWKTFFLLLSTVLSFLILWVATSDLFDVPKDVRKDRQLYFIARQQYLDNPHYWYSQYLQLESSLRQAIRENREQDTIDLLQQITPQALTAFLVHHTNIKIERLKSFAVIPTLSGSSFIIKASKPEADIWPFKVMLSVEIQVNLSTDSEPVLIPLRFRRGSQELDSTLGWTYFLPELGHMQNLPFVLKYPHKNIPG